MDRIKLLKLYKESLRTGIIDDEILLYLINDEIEKNEYQDYVKEISFKENSNVCGYYNPIEKKIYIQKDIESFDAAWFIGNSYNYHSYDSFKMPPVFYIKNSGYAFKWEDSSIKRDPKSFVFFGSLGAVHKGLDLLLEVFSKITTDCKLYVCAGYERENDFCEEYHNELYSKPNIVPMGFVDINSDRFKDMVQSCAYTILPSCAEGCAGSVLTVMSGGLIPIVSSVCGFSENEAIVLPDCKVETIAAYVKEYSCKDEAWIAQNSQKAIEIVNQKFSQNDFSDSVNMAIKGTLALHKDK